MNEHTVIDPYELVKDLADRIGIHQLYAITCDIRGEGNEVNGTMLNEIEELKRKCAYLESRSDRLSGEIDGYRYALECIGGITSNKTRIV